MCLKHLLCAGSWPGWCRCSQAWCDAGALLTISQGVLRLRPTLVLWILRYILHWLSWSWHYSFWTEGSLGRDVAEQGLWIVSNIFLAPLLPSGSEKVWAHRAFLRIREKLRIFSPGKICGPIRLSDFRHLNIFSVLSRVIIMRAGLDSTLKLPVLVLNTSRGSPHIESIKIPWLRV